MAQILSQSEVAAFEQGRQIKRPAQNEDETLSSDQVEAQSKILSSTGPSPSDLHYENRLAEHNEGSRFDNNDEIPTIVPQPAPKQSAPKPKQSAPRAEQPAPANLAADDRQRAMDLIRAEIVRRQLAGVAPKPAPAKQPDDVDFFADPKAAVAAVVEQAVAPFKQIAQRERAKAIEGHKATNAATFNSEFPDAHDTIADPAFREWVGKSKVRQALLKRADAMYDLDAAREVLGTWNELRGSQRPQPRQSAARSSSDGKLFRRSEILKLMTEDPAKYERMADTIAKAYREGRVR